MTDEEFLKAVDDYKGEKRGFIFVPDSFNLAEQAFKKIKEMGFEILTIRVLESNGEIGFLLIFAVAKDLLDGGFLLGVLRDYDYRITTG